jgi:hypothetical protein
LHSRGAFLPGLAVSLLLSWREGAGVPGCALHPRSRVPACARILHTSIQGSGEHSDIPCAMVLRLTSCSSRWSELVVTVSRQRTAADLTPAYAAPEPHDLTVRSGNIRLWTAASIASRAQRVVTMAIRPSCGHETGMVIVLIFGNVKRNLLRTEWTIQIKLKLLKKLGFKRSRFGDVLHLFSPLLP